MSSSSPTRINNNHSSPFTFHSPPSSPQKQEQNNNNNNTNNTSLPPINHHHQPQQQQQQQTPKHNADISNNPDDNNTTDDRQEKVTRRKKRNGSGSGSSSKHRIHDQVISALEAWNNETTLPMNNNNNNNNNNNKHHASRQMLEPIEATDTVGGYQQQQKEDKLFHSDSNQIRVHHTNHQMNNNNNRRRRNNSNNNNLRLTSASTPQPTTKSNNNNNTTTTSLLHNHQNRIEINDSENFRFMSSKTPEPDPYVMRENNNNDNSNIYTSYNQRHQQQQQTKRTNQNSSSNRRKNKNNNDNNNNADDFSNVHDSLLAHQGLVPAEESLVSKQLLAMNNNSDDNNNFSSSSSLHQVNNRRTSHSRHHFNMDEFYVLRLLIAGDSKSGKGLAGKSAKLPVQLPHVDLGWMRPLFKTKDGNPPPRSEVEKTLKENGKKNLLNLNLDCFQNETRDYGSDALHPVLINSPRSAIVLLRNGIAVTKLLSRPPAFYATDKAGGRRSPDRLLLHLRKQRADEVRHHLVTSITAQYKQLCDSIDTADAVLSCCPPKPEEPELIVEEQLAKEMEQLEKLKNRTTMAVSKNVREERELKEKVAARQQRSESSELVCRERRNAKVETLKEKAERRAEKIRRLRNEENLNEKHLDQQFREVLESRQDQMIRFKDQQRQEQERKHFSIMKRLREAQDAHYEAERVRKRRLKAKIEVKDEKITTIKDEKEAELELRKLDYEELQRMRNEAKERAKENTLDYRRRAAQKVLAAAHQSDEAELKLARKRNLRKAIGEIEEEKRSEVIHKAKKMFEERQNQFESKFTDEQIQMAERALARAEIARMNAADRTLENAEKLEAHDMSSQQQAFQKLLAVASLARKEDVAAAHAQKKKVTEESAHWIRDVARHHFSEQKKKIADMLRAQHQ